MDQVENGVICRTKAQKINRPFQREGANSNTQVGSDFEEIARQYFESLGMAVESNVSIYIGVHDKKKAHKFDLVDKIGKVLIECKSNTWTVGGNVPSAKMTTWNQAMYYFHASPAGYRKILFVLSDLCPRRNITLGQYYIQMNSHLIPSDVEIFEFDVMKKVAVQIK